VRLCLLEEENCHKVIVRQLPIIKSLSQLFLLLTDTALQWYKANETRNGIRR
jgi:hypothetical protein